MLRGETAEGDGVIELGIQVEPDRSFVLRVPLEWEQLQEPGPTDAEKATGAERVAP